MKYHEGSMLEALRRIDTFLDAQPTAFAPLMGSAARQELTDTITQLSASATAQEVGGRASRGETSKLGALRLALRIHQMDPIAAIAKLRLPAVPDFSSLTTPRSTVSTERLLAAAAAMGEAAARHAAVFTANGLPADFIVRLQASAQALQDAIDGRSGQTVVRSGATATLAAEERRGRTIITVLNGLLLPLIGADAGLQAAWTTAKRVARKPGVKIGARASAAPADATTQGSTTQGSTTQGSTTQGSTTQGSTTQGSTTQGTTTQGSTQGTTTAPPTPPAASTPPASQLPAV